MSSDTPPYKELHEVFKSIREHPLSLDEVGQILNILSLELGIVSADLVSRGISPELIDKHIKRSCLKGVDIYLEKSPGLNGNSEAVLRLRTSQQASESSRKHT